MRAVACVMLTTASVVAWQAVPACRRAPTAVRMSGAGQLGSGAVASTRPRVKTPKQEEILRPDDRGDSAAVSPSAAADRIASSGGATVWSEFGALALETGATNLGQGFPDWQPPEFVVQAAQDALRGGGVHQYTRSAGHPPLVEVLARRYSSHFDRPVEPMTEVAVTVGASQALYVALQALLNPGDEVLLPEPAFDLYYGQVRLAGGRVRPVPLLIDPETRQWRMDVDALAREAATGQPKLLILNSPHNPTGTVFSRAEMEAVAAVVRMHPNLYVVSDEVYKFTVFAEEAQHFHFASLPGMFDRTVTVSSAGKTF
jgi:kynurenine--oxoglutarate transaminase/cysteine-S-conjugate beta-lyase/glutamine--phenylpyruvate transaminase